MINSKEMEVKSGRFDQLTDSERKQLKFSILKNVIVISIAFMLLFTAFQSMANLQSSINKVRTIWGQLFVYIFPFKVDGLGTWSLVTIYATLVLSCMFVPTLMISKLTVKYTMVASILCYSTYIAAQFYPEFYTLVPGAIILGLGAAPMWSAKCTYLSQVKDISFQKNIFKNFILF